MPPWTPSPRESLPQALRAPRARFGLAPTVCAAVALALASPAAAQDRASLPITLAALDSADPSEVGAALSSLGLLGDPRAVEPIAARVRAGLPPDLLLMAVETLGLLGRREAGPTLVRLTHHRRPEVRLAAVRALVASQPATGAPPTAARPTGRRRAGAQPATAQPALAQPAGAEQALVEALADVEPAVRGAAAEGLGAIRARGALDALFRALERDVPEAAIAIGLLAGPPEVQRFLGLLGRVSMDLLTPALSEMLARTDLSEPARVSIVERIRDLATPGARQFLESFIASTDAAQGGRPRALAADAIGGMSQ